MVEDAGYAESATAIDAKTPGYEIFGPGADVCPRFCVVGECGEVADSNPLATRCYMVQSLDFGVKRKVSREQSVHDDTERPYIGTR